MSGSLVSVTANLRASANAMPAQSGLISGAYVAIACVVLLLVLNYRICRIIGVKNKRGLLWMR